MVYVGVIMMIFSRDIGEDVFGSHSQFGVGLQGGRAGDVYRVSGTWQIQSGGQPR